MCQRVVSALNVVFLGSVLAIAARGGEASPPIVLWPERAPGETADAGQEKTLPMRAGDTTIRITDITRPTLNIFRPSPEKNTGAAVIICPGGGYNYLCYNKEGTEIADWLNSIGVTGIVLKYRVPARKDQPKQRAPLQDLQRGLGIVRHRAREWGIDPARLGILGVSAGGYVAAAASTSFEPRAYAPLDEADQVSCRPDFALLVYPAYLVNPKDNSIAPELEVTANTPPTFLAQTEDDSVRVECSLYYYLALLKAKVPAELHVYPTGGHGYGLRQTGHAISSWPERAEAWMKSRGLLDPKTKKPST